MGTSYSDLGLQRRNIITDNSYNSLPIHATVSPIRLTFNILRERIESGHTYNIEIISSIDPNRKIRIFLTQIFTNNMVTTTHINNNPGISIDYEKGNTNTPVFSITIRNGSVFTLTGIGEDNKYAINEDTYTFLYDGVNTDIPSQLRFYRDKNLNTSPNKPVNKFSAPDPSILINSQTLIDGSDIGNTIFRIINDTEKHYEKNCVLIFSVLKGEGKTAAEKVENIFLTNELPINFYQFGLNIIKYSMLRYFLSKLLYGNFNTDYLLQVYYDDFLKDLKNSKYNSYLNYFINYNSEYYLYDQFFLI